MGLKGRFVPGGPWLWLGEARRGPAWAVRRSFNPALTICVYIDNTIESCVTLIY